MSLLLNSLLFENIKFEDREEGDKVREVGVEVVIVFFNGDINIRL